MRTIVEGVENEDQMELLILNGCDYMQGNYFSEPLSKENFIEIYNSLEGIDKNKKTWK